MTVIVRMIDDFKFNQEILVRKPAYIIVCMSRLSKWKNFMLNKLEIFEVEDVKALFISKGL